MNCNFKKGDQVYVGSDKANVYAIAEVRPRNEGTGKCKYDLEAKNGDITENVSEDDLLMA